MSAFDVQTCRFIELFTVFLFFKAPDGAEGGSVVQVFAVQVDAAG